MENGHEEDLYWKTALGLICESSQLADRAGHRTGLLHNVLYTMLCRCVRVLSRQGGGGASASRIRATSTRNETLNKRTSSSLWPQQRPIAVYLAPSSTPANNRTGGNAREGLQLLPDGDRGIVFKQQQRRCLSAMAENELQEVEDSKSYRTERVKEVIEDGIRELRVQLRSKSEEGSNGSRRVRRGDRSLSVEATVARSLGKDTAGVLRLCFESLRL